MVLVGEAPAVAAAAAAAEPPPPPAAAASSPASSGLKRSAEMEGRFIEAPQ